MRAHPFRLAQPPRPLALIALLALLLGGVPVSPHAAARQPAACVTPGTATPTFATPVATFPLTVTDDAGREVVVASRPERIVSIAPSTTEILFALGLDDRVVGVDDYSDFPPAAAAKPRLGGMVDPDLEPLVATTPDLVLATGLQTETVVPALEELGIPVAVIDPGTVDEVFAGIALVGRITGGEAAAAELACKMRHRIDAIAARVAGAPQPRVFFELSPDLYTAGPGSYVDDLITRAGGSNVAADAGTEWPQLGLEALVAGDPEVILLADEEAGVTPEQVRARPGWHAIGAVVDGRIVAVDPDLTNRPGPRVVDGLEAIARALHPDRFR